MESIQRPVIKIQSYISLLGECDKRSKAAGSPHPTQRPGTLSQYIFGIWAEPCITKPENSTPAPSHHFCIARELGDEMARVRGHLDEQPVPRREMKPKHPLINASYRGRHLIMNFPAGSHTDTNSVFTSGIQKLLTAEHLFKAFCAANEGWRNFN